MNDTSNARRVFAIVSMALALAVLFGAVPTTAPGEGMTRQQLEAHG
jgi:hypothetical protein